MYLVGHKLFNSQNLKADIRVFLIVFLFGLLPHANAQESGTSINLTTEERTWLNEHPEIQIIVDPEAAPLMFINNEGEVSGVVGDYYKIFGEKLGVNFVWAGNKNWAEGLQMVRDGDVEVVPVTNITPNRSEFLDFSSEYVVHLSHVIFTRAGGTRYGNMDTLLGKKISQVNGFAITGRIERDYPGIEIVKADTVVDALNLLIEGQVDAYVGSMTMTSHYIMNEGLMDIIVVGDTPYRGSNAIGVRKDLALLSSALNKALLSITAEQRAEISRRWLSVRVSNGIDYTLMFQIAGVIAIIMFVIMLWNAKLRQEVSRRKKAEESLISANRSTEEALIVAENANASKSIFLANMSHELRTPLNAIIGFSDLMLMGSSGKIKEPTYLGYLKDIKNSGEHLVQVIKDILDISKIEAGKWKMLEEEFMLIPALDYAIKVLSPLTEQKNIKVALFSQDDDIEVYGDEHAIKRVFINLLSNATKFTPNNGSIECHVKRAKHGDIVISVTDTGIGINSEKLKTVMSEFEQSHEIKGSKEEGTGLGLSIVKNLIALHGGKLDISSVENEGTTVTVVLPKERIVERL